ncbi:MAG: hypothetical protein ACP5I1_04905 [Candidatus Hinthialibacter sp.]
MGCGLQAGEKFEKRQRIHPSGETPKRWAKKFGGKMELVMQSLLLNNT